MSGVVDEHVLRLDAFMNKALPMGLAECCGHTDGCAQKASEIDRMSLVLID